MASTMVSNTPIEIITLLPADNYNNSVVTRSYIIDCYLTYYPVPDRAQSLESIPCTKIINVAKSYNRLWFLL